MCGISGIFQFDNKVDVAELTEFNLSLTHRGPDFQSTHISTSGNLGLGHCRLSIVDTSSVANQPFLSDDNSCALSFNGEIYNYVEIRAELEALGYQFRTHSDTEVLLTSYQAWGEACVHKFNGMWAFAIWDEQKQHLFLARDRFGVKSLYYRSKEQYFAFASEQKAFKKHHDGLSISSTQASFLMLYPEAVESERGTLYEGIEKLLPGEYMIVSKNNTKICKWWNTYQYLASGNYASDAQSLTELFINACEIRTRTDVKIATSLSGGLDSSAVTSALAILPNLITSKSLKTYVGSFENSPLDEFKWAKSVIDKYHLNFERVNIRGDDALSHLETTCLALEDVTSLPAIGQWLVYQNMKNDGYKVSIEGHAGDELLGGYQRHINVYLGDLLQQRKSPERLAQVLTMLADMNPEIKRNFVRGNVLNAPLDAASLHGKLKNKKLYLKALLFGDYDFQKDIVTEHDVSEYRQEDMLFQKLYEDFHYYSLPNILKNYDRLSMANSVEIRSPFLDYRFVLAAFRANSDLKIANGRNKTLIREHFEFVPEKVRNRTDKSGFTPPMQQWLQSSLIDWLSDLMSDSRITASTLFDGKTLSETVRFYIRNKQLDKVLLYWPLINLALLDRGTREFN